MKKILFSIIITLSFINFLNADCTYKDKKELNTLASFVEYNYEFNDNTNMFDLTVYNLSDVFNVEYKNDTYEQVNGEVKINNIKPGEKIRLDIVVNKKSDCIEESLRIININIPYINNYYKSSECTNHEELNVCSSKFLDYELSYNTFISLLNKDKGFTNKKVKEEVTIEDNFFNKILIFIKKYYMPVSLFVLGTTLTLIILRPIYRKIEHGL